MIANLRRSAAPLITTIQRLFSEDLAKENDFLRQENRILRSKLGRRVPLTEANPRTLVRYGPVLSKQLVPAEFLRGASRRGTSPAWEASAGLHHRQRQRRPVTQNRVPARTLVHFALRKRRGAKTVAMVSGRWAADGLGSGTLAIPFRKARSSSSGKMPRGRCLQADPRMRQEHRERRTIPSQNGHD